MGLGALRENRESSCGVDRRCLARSAAAASRLSLSLSLAVVFGGAGARVLSPSCCLRDCASEWLRRRRRRKSQIVLDRVWSAVLA